MSACIRGCTIRGQHTADCATECAGCLPRPAVEGLLCAWDYARLVADVESLPSLIAHLGEMAEPDAGHQAGGDGRSGGDPAHRTILPAATLTADELEIAVCGWVLIVMEDLGLEGPAMRWTMGGRRKVGAETWGEPPKPVAARDMRALVKWLLPHLPWVAQQEWVGEMRGDLGREISTAKARWPMVERGHAVPMPCPRCESLTLWYSPPAWAGASMRVECLSPDCGRVFAEEEWVRMRGLMVIAAGRTA